MSGQHSNHMRQTDAFLWGMESDPVMRSTICGVLVFDQAPDWRHVVARTDKASRLIPALRQKVVESPLRLAPPRWTYDRDFDLSWHLRRLRVPEDAGMEWVVDFARRAEMDDFDRARPLWEFTLIEGLDGGGAAMVARMHHSIADGLGAIQLMGVMFDFHPGAGDNEMMPEAPAGEVMSPLARVGDAVRYDARRVREIARQYARDLPGAFRALRNPLVAAGSAARTAWSVARFLAPVTSTMSPLMTERGSLRHFAVLEVSVDDLKRAAKAAGGSLNDAYLAAAGGGLARYHRKHGLEVESLRIMMPISLRDEGDPLGGNRATLARTVVPAGIVDPAERIRGTREQSQVMRAEPYIALSNAIAGALNVLPLALTTGILKNIDFIATNIPGLTEPVYLGDARLVAMYPFGATLGTGVTYALSSYTGTAYVGIHTDVRAIADPVVLAECTRDAFDEVLDLAGDHEPAVLVAAPSIGRDDAFRQRLDPRSGRRPRATTRRGSV